MAAGSADPAPLASTLDPSARGASFLGASGGPRADEAGAPRFDVGRVAARVPPSRDLLTFYQDRVKSFEDERRAMVDKIGEIGVQHEELHRLRAQLQVREDEILELQKALSDANTYLYDEREQVMKLAAENEALKIQELEDRRRIQHLLALTQPVAQEVTFFRDCRPESLTRYPAASASDLDPDGSGSSSGSGSGSGGTVGGSAASGISLAGAVGGGGARGGGPGARARPTSAPRGGRATGRGGVALSAAHTSSTVMVGPAVGSGAGATGAAAPFKSRVLRTVYLPSERADALLLRVETLQKQLEEANRFAEERSAAFRADREAREAAATRKNEDDARRIRTLETDLHDTRAKLRAALAELLTTRQGAQRVEAELRERVAALEAAGSTLVRDLEATRGAASAEVAALKRAADEEASALREFAKAQAARREEDVRLLQRQYEEVRAVYDERVAGLEARIEQQETKFRALQRRRAREMEGFTHDVVHLRRALRQLETQWALVGEGTGPVVSGAAFPSAAGLAPALEALFLQAGGDLGLGLSHSHSRGDGGRGARASGAAGGSGGSRTRKSATAAAGPLALRSETERVREEAERARAAGRRERLVSAGAFRPTLGASQPAVSGGLVDPSRTRARADAWRGGAAASASTGATGRTTRPASAGAAMPSATRRTGGGAKVDIWGDGSTASGPSVGTGSVRSGGRGRGRPEAEGVAHKEEEEEDEDDEEGEGEEGEEDEEGREGGAYEREDEVEDPFGRGESVPFVGRVREEDDMRFGEAGRLNEVWRPSQLQAELDRTLARTAALESFASSQRAERGAARREGHGHGRRDEERSRGRRS